jgi:hypothetical protein
MSRWANNRQSAAQQKEAYSITSSARPSTVGGMTRPSALGRFEVDDVLVLGRRLGTSSCIEITDPVSTCVFASQHPINCIAQSPVERHMNEFRESEKGSK